MAHEVNGDFCWLFTITVQ